ncbi:hypothetical protein Tco_0429420 [Tanacetum coccineum]
MPKGRLSKKEAGERFRDGGATYAFKECLVEHAKVGGMWVTVAGGGGMEGAAQATTMLIIGMSSIYHYRLWCESCSFTDEIKTLIVEGDKGMSRLKVISCIKARKYVKRGCHLFLAHVMENKSKRKRKGRLACISYFPEVFHEDFLGLPPSRQVEFRIDLVLGAAPVARAPY